MTMKFAEMTRDEIRARAPAATVVVPVGSVEQHGPHLPVGADALIVAALAERAVTLAGAEIPIVVVPTLPFGFAHHHLGFGGTVSVPFLLYTDLLTEIGASLAASGFRRIVYLNSHGGNDAAVRAVGDRLVFERHLPIHVAATSYWEWAGELRSTLDLSGAPIPGHAGAFETSCLLALRPDLVRMNDRPAPEVAVQPLARMRIPGATVRRHGIWQESDGRTDDSSAASAAAGDEALGEIARSLAQFLVAFHHSATPVDS